MTKSRPAARVVVLDGAWGSATEIQRFDLTSSTDDLATILHDLGSGLRSHLSGLGADRVVIRRADLPAVASKREGPRVRLLAEGALAGAARDEINDVLVLPGKDLGGRTPAGSKAGLDAEAALLVQASHVEAAAAALSGLVP
jgi:hypothetical protein